MIKFLAMLILVIGMAYGAEEASKLSPADQAAIDKAIDSNLNEPSKAYQAYQAALTKASDKAIKDLEKLKAGAMKGNNLPLAVAIDGKIAEVRKNGLGSVIVEKAEKAGDLLGDDKKVDVAKAIVGKWQLLLPDGPKGTNIEHQIKPDGSVIAANGAYKGKITISDDKASFVMEWHDTSRDFTVELPVKDSMTALTSFGKTTFKKMK